MNRMDTRSGSCRKIERWVHSAYADAILRIGSTPNPESPTPSPIGHPHRTDHLHIRSGATCNLKEWTELLDATQHRLGIADLVPRIVESFRPWHLGILGIAAMTCPDLQSAGALLHQYQQISDNVFILTCKIESGEFVIQLLESTEIECPAFARLALSLLAESIRWLTHLPDLQLQADLKAPSTPLESEYARLFGGHVRFGRPVNQIKGDAALVKQRLMTHSPESHGVLVNELRRLCNRMEQDKYIYLDRVRMAVLQNLEHQSIKLHDIADFLGVPARTMQRKLQAHGVTLQDIIQEARLEKARYLLQTESISLPDLASQLGFGDQSSFTRAFKRWTGTTPGSFRRESRRD